MYPAGQTSLGAPRHRRGRRPRRPAEFAPIVAFVRVGADIIRPHIINCLFGEKATIPFHFSLKKAPQRGAFFMRSSPKTFYFPPKSFWGLGSFFKKTPYITKSFIRCPPEGEPARGRRSPPHPSAPRQRPPRRREWSRCPWPYRGGPASIRPASPGIRGNVLPQNP